MLSNPWPSWLCLHKKSRNVTKGIKMATLMTSWSRLVFQSQNNHKKLQQHQSYHWYSCLYNRMSESGKNPVKKTHTVRNLHFLSKNSTLISRENCGFFGGVKNSWKCCGFGRFSCWQLWFHEKNCQKYLVKNLWKCWGFVLSRLNFWTKNEDFEQCEIIV